MDSGWFRCELLGTGEGGEQVRGLICDSGDPGNRATVKFVCESALCLALKEGDLPKRGGILTPSTGLGEVLAQRLLRAGMEIEVKMGSTNIDRGKTIRRSQKMYLKKLQSLWSRVSPYKYWST